MRLGPHQDSKQLEPTAKPTRQLTMDNGETAENNMGEGKDKSREISDFKVSYYDLPAQQTFREEGDSTPYHPHTQSKSKTSYLK